MTNPVIRWLVDREHVSATPKEIVDLMRTKIAKFKTFPPRKKRTIYQLALKHHNHNRDLYRRVTAGRI